MIEVQGYMFFDPTKPDDAEMLESIRKIGGKLEGLHMEYLAHSSGSSSGFAKPVPINNWSYTHNYPSYRADDALSNFMWRVSNE